MRLIIEKRQFHNNLPVRLSSRNNSLIWSDIQDREDDYTSAFVIRLAYLDPAYYVAIRIFDIPLWSSSHVPPYNLLSVSAFWNFLYDFCNSSWICFMDSVICNLQYDYHDSLNHFYFLESGFQDSRIPDTQFSAKCWNEESLKANCSEVSLTQVLVLKLR